MIVLTTPKAWNFVDERTGVQRAGQSAVTIKIKKYVLVFIFSPSYKKNQSTKKKPKATDKIFHLHAGTFFKLSNKFSY